jgi:hypothetical protein
VRTLTVPGVYREQSVVAAPARLATGVPAFIGFADARAGLHAPAPAALASAGLAAPPRKIAMWTQFATLFAPPDPPGFLAEAVRCFFANGGESCVVAALRPGAPPASAFTAALVALEANDDVDLVCAPDAVWRPGASDADPLNEADLPAMLALHGAVVDHCERLGDRFALLDSLPALAVGDLRSGGVLRQRAARSSDMAALYYPWVRPSGTAGARAVPPCGHVAGLISRTDRDVGVHRAPANLPLEEIVAVTATVARPDLGGLAAAGVNVIRPIPGRGVRVWGARTLSGDPQWRYVSVRRLAIALRRWARVGLSDFAFEPNEPALWRRLRLATEVRLEEMFRAGALAGATPQEAFYVRCDAATTSQQERELGKVVVEVGFAPTVPNEFVVVHIVRDATGVSAATG